MTMRPAASPLISKRRLMPENFASAAARDIEADSDLHRDRDRGERIHRDMNAGRGNRHGAQRLALTHDFEARRETVDDDFLGAQVGVGRHAIRDHRLANRGQQRAHIDAVDAENSRAIERHVIDEAQKRIAHAIDISIMIEVLGIDVGNDRERRHQQQKRRVALVGLGHHVVTAPEAYIAAARAQISADRNGRIEAGLLEDEADEPGGRRLTVRARNCDADARHPQQLAEHLGARNHRNLHLASARHFRIGKFHRGRDHHRIEFGSDVRRMMPAIDFGAERSQAAQ